MNTFRFQILEMRPSTARDWLVFWAKWYEDETGYDPEYNDLITKHQSFSAEEFRRIGKWKDNAISPGKWKPNVASVAYLIWEQVAVELPHCPSDDEVEGFLNDWANRTYKDTFRDKPPRTKVFGVPRATTILHFVSGGRYPIFDSRVRTAIARLLGRRKLPDTVGSYLHSYVPLFNELADCCGTKDDLRMLDKALFSFGAIKQEHFLKLSHWLRQPSPGTT